MYRYVLEPIFGQILSKITRFSKNWFKINSNLGKLGKIHPLIIVRGHLYTKRLILLPMLMAHPRRVFLLSNPVLLNYTFQYNRPIGKKEQYSNPEFYN